MSQVAGTKQPSAAIALDRILPNSLDAEMAVLGAMLLSPGEAALEAQSRLTDNDFYHSAHQVIYREFAALQDAGIPVDLVSMTQRLRDLNQLEEIGGPSYLTDLIARCPTTTNVEHYINIVVEKSLLRQLIGAGHEVISRSFEQQDDVEGWLTDVLRQIQTITDGDSKGGFEHVKEIILAAMQAIEQMYERKGTITGLATGFRDLDKMTSGLHDGEMIVIAGRPAMGKTALALNIAEHVAIDQQIPVGIFSLEMSKKELGMRLIASRAEVDLKAMAGGFVPERCFHALTAAASQILKSPLYIDDSPGLTIAKIHARAKQLVKTKKIRLLIIDYIQLMRAPSRRAEQSRQQEVSDISQFIKGLAKELGIPIMALSQLNRSPDGRSDGRPKVSDLRESGSIEQDADVVGLMYRPEVYAQDEEKAELKGQAFLIIGKQRNGPTGDVDLVFRGEYTRFEDRAKVDDSDAPELAEE